MQQCLRTAACAAALELDFAPRWRGRALRAGSGTRSPRWPTSAAASAAWSFLLSSRASGRLAAEDHLHFCSPEKALCLHLLLEVFSCRQLLRTALVHVTMGLGQSSAFAPDASGTLLADGSRWGVFDPQKAGKSCSLERVKFDLQAIGHRLLTSVTSIGC